MLKESSERADLDPAERETVAKRLRWVSAAAAIEVRASCERLGSAATMRCENPLLVRQGPEDLELLVTKGYQSSAGIPIRYVGGPLKFRWRMRISPHRFGVSPRVGLFGTNSLFLFFNLSGAEAEPRQKQQLLSLAPSWPVTSSPESDNLFMPGEDWFDVELEYVPALESAWVVMTQGAARHEVVLNLPTRLPPAVYLFGAVGYPDPPVESEPSTLHLRNIRIMASDAGTGIDPSPPDTPEEILRAAHGHFAQGRFDQALTLYDSLLQPAGSLPLTTARTCAFFRALALGRNGSAETARELLSGLRAQDPELYRLLRLQSLPGASPADAALLAR